MEQTRWEYKVVRYFEPRHSSGWTTDPAGAIDKTVRWKTDIEVLEELGQDSWELVSVAEPVYSHVEDGTNGEMAMPQSTTTMYFKRRLG